MQSPRLVIIWDEGMLCYHSCHEHELTGSLVSLAFAMIPEYVCLMNVLTGELYYADENDQYNITDCKIPEFQCLGVPYPAGNLSDVESEDDYPMQRKPNNNSDFYLDSSEENDDSDYSIDFSLIEHKQPTHEEIFDPPRNCPIELLPVEKDRISLLIQKTRMILHYKVYSKNSEKAGQRRYPEGCYGKSDSKDVRRKLRRKVT